MSDHRLALDPGSVGRLCETLAVIQRAWEGDVAELRRVESELADTMRLLNAATDRANDLQADLRAAREENDSLIRRNAHLEAQVRTIYEKSMDAQDALGSLASRAVEAARAPIPDRNAAAAAKIGDGAWKDPEKNPAGDDDGTDLPRGTPEFITGAIGTRPPINTFASQTETSQ